MKFEDLPKVLPLYAATGTILLPRAQLPLILQGKEERSLMEDAFQEGNRLIGVIQTTPEGSHFQKGCVGRIIAFQEGFPLYITLGGICRFNIEEILQETPFKKARITYQGYENDLDLTIADPLVDRSRLLDTLKDYLEDQDILANWEEIDHASDDLIISALSMICPFKPIEKQALLEVSTLSERCDMMIALMEMAAPQLKGRLQVLH